MNYVLWFTGLSGSGKSTLANNLAKVLKKKKFNVHIIDGDEFRKKVHNSLGFSPKEIILNNRKIIDHCTKHLERYDFISGKTLFILVPVIAPFGSTRLLARKKLGKKYIEIFCKASIKTCAQRDPKGLYKKALSGEIKNFIGVDNNVLYEIPKHPDIIVDTENLEEQESLQIILNYLKIRKIYV